MRTTSKFCSAALSISVIVLGNSFLTQTASAAPADDDNINQSIVFVDITTVGRVEVLYQDDTSEVYETSTTGLCTGWFVSDNGHVATAGHCLEVDASTVRSLYENVILENDVGTGNLSAAEFAASLDIGEWDYELDDPIVNVSQPDVVKGPLDEDYVRAQIIDQQPFENGDNALLKLSGVKDTPALSVASSIPAVGEEVTAIGYAGSVSKVTDINRQPPSHKQGSVSSHTTTDKGAPVTEVDAAVSQGMSGGPTVNEEGAVVGINSFGVVGESQPFNFITDTESLVQFLEKNGVDVATVTGGSSEEQTTPESSGAAPASDRSVEVTANEENDDTSPIVWVGGTLGVIALAVAAFFGFKKLRRNSANPS